MPAIQPVPQETYSPDQMNATIHQVAANLSNLRRMDEARSFLQVVNDIDGQLEGRSAGNVLTGVTGTGELVGMQYRLARTFTLYMGNLAGSRIISTELDPSVGLHPWNEDHLHDFIALRRRELHINANEVPRRGPTQAIAEALGGRSIDIYRIDDPDARMRYGLLRVPAGRIGTEPLVGIPGIFRIMEGAERRFPRPGS
jgi:hypothetical protein